MRSDWHTRPFNLQMTFKAISLYEVAKGDSVDRKAVYRTNPGALRDWRDKEEPIKEKTKTWPVSYQENLESFSTENRIDQGLMIYKDGD